MKYNLKITAECEDRETKDTYTHLTWEMTATSDDDEHVSPTDTSRIRLPDSDPDSFVPIEKVTDEMKKAWLFDYYKREVTPAVEARDAVPETEDAPAQDAIKAIAATYDSGEGWLADEKEKLAGWLAATLDPPRPPDEPVIFSV